MQLAINTGSLAADTQKARERAADLGFGSVESNIGSQEFGYGYRRKPDAGLFRQIRADLDKKNLTVWSVSAPRLSHEQMFSELSRREILKGGAIAAGLLGAKVLVVQPADIFISQKSFDGYIQDHKAPAVIAGFDEAWVQVVNRKMTMALVNRDYWIGTLLTNQAERLAKIANDIAIGCALDIRQALNRNDLGTWLEKVGDRLAAAYAYDLSESGLLIAPMEEEWDSWISTLNNSRLKTVIVQAQPLQEDDEIIRSRLYFEDILA